MVPLAQSQLDLGRQLQQAQVVGHSGAVLAHLFAQLFLGKLHFVDEALEADGHLDGIEFFALDVLHQRHLQHGLVVGDADVGGHLYQAGQLRSTEAALTADQLIAVITHLPHGDRLYDTKFADALGQFGQGLITEMGARLEGVRFDLRHRDGADGTGTAWRSAHRAHCAW
jgi:hypothetical protein